MVSFLSLAASEVSGVQRILVFIESVKKTKKKGGYLEGKKRAFVFFPFIVNWHPAALTCNMFTQQT